MKRSVVREMPEIQVEIRGEMPPRAVDYAREKVQAAVGRTRQPILFARVKLSQGRDPAVRRSAVAQAVVDVNGRPARAQVAAESMYQAIDQLRDRLEYRLGRLSENWQARRGTQPVADPHEWRHGEEPSRHPEYFPRPAEEREVVRHKSFTIPRETPDEAAFEMESMDYNFHLFTDADTGQDSVLYRSGPTGYRLAQVEPRIERLGPIAAPVTMSGSVAPRMSVTEAREKLEVAGYPFVFFVDTDSGRGAILYHRYDGHYGLITPAD